MEVHPYFFQVLCSALLTPSSLLYPCRYTIVFDATYSFVHSGLVESDSRPPHTFGRDLVYINAAIESQLHQRRRESDENSRSTGQYLDLLREWERAGASRPTLRMLGNVAMSVLNGDHNIIDYNL